MNENLTELDGGCIYQSFALLQFVLWLLKEAIAIVLHLPFGSGASGVTLEKSRQKSTVEHDGIFSPMQQVWWSRIMCWLSRSCAHSGSG